MKKPVTKNDFEVLLSLKNQMKSKKLSNDERIELIGLIDFQTRKVNSLEGVK